MTATSRALFEADVLRLANRAIALVYVKGDDAGTIVFANETAERMFGFQFGELEGQSVEVLVPDTLKAAHPHHRAGYILDPTIRAMGQGAKLYGRRKNGAQFPVIVNLAPGYVAGELHVLAMIAELVDVPVGSVTTK